MRRCPGRAAGPASASRLTGRCWKEVRRTSRWVSRPVTGQRCSRPGRHRNGARSPPRRPVAVARADRVHQTRMVHVCLGRQHRADVRAQQVAQHLAQVGVHRGQTSLCEAATTARWKVASASTKASASPDSQASSRRSSSASSCRRSCAVRRRGGQPGGLASRARAARRRAGVGVGEPAVHHPGQLAGRDDVGARALPDVEQTVVRERPDGLADGVAGHPELLDQLRLGRDAGAHRPLARGDLGAQLRRSPGRTARIGGGGQGHGGPSRGGAGGRCRGCRRAVVPPGREAIGSDWTTIHPMIL